MNGLGILRGLWITFTHFINTYVDDLKYGRRRYKSKEGIQYRSSVSVKGIFTVQYPEEKLSVPEEFRFLPFLVYETDPNGEKKYRCTACGICTKVCPPQCIWITRQVDPVSGKPASQSAEFYIDIDICMNCGFCAEYCPFDAIKMGHEYEIATANRQIGHIYNKEKLGKSVTYYSWIRPLNFTREEEARAAKAAKKGVSEATPTS